MYTPIHIYLPFSIKKLILDLGNSRRHKNVPFLQAFNHISEWSGQRWWMELELGFSSWKYYPVRFNLYLHLIPLRHMLRSSRIVIMITDFHLPCQLASHNYMWETRSDISGLIKQIWTPHISQRQQFNVIRPKFNGYDVILSMHSILA